MLDGMEVYTRGMRSAWVSLMGQTTSSDGPDNGRSQLWGTDGQVVVGRGEWRLGRLGEACGRLFSGLDRGMDIWRWERIYMTENLSYYPQIRPLHVADI